MSKYVNGLYLTKYGGEHAADVYIDGLITSGYSSEGQPLWYQPLKDLKYYPKRPFEDFVDEYFIDPELIAPFNLIKWED